MNALVFKLLAQRIALALLSLLVVSVIVFAITAVLPGDAAQEQLGDIRRVPRHRADPARRWQLAPRHDAPQRGADQGVCEVVHDSVQVSTAGVISVTRAKHSRACGVFRETKGGARQ